MAGVNVEALVVAWLKADDAVSTEVAGRVSTEVPPDPTYPLVTIRGITGVEAVRRRLDDHRVQVDCLADTRPKAALLARIVQGAFERLEGQAVTYPEEGADDPVTSMVSASEVILLPRWLPDTTGPTPKPLFTADYRVLAHPT